mgnify:CR=1 FL=1
MRGLLCAGLLVREIGALAAACRHFGSRRCGGLWKQRPGLSLCEAAVRECCRSIETSRHADSDAAPGEVTERQLLRTAPPAETAAGRPFQENGVSFGA